MDTAKYIEQLELRLTILHSKEPLKWEYFDTQDHTSGWITCSLVTSVAGLPPPRFKIRLVKADPYAALKQAYAEGKTIEINAGSASEPDWVAVPDPTWCTFPRWYRIKTWALPAPPEGRQWHRNDWTEAMLPPGWRPLLLGEEDGPDVEWFNSCEFWAPCARLARLEYAAGDWRPRRTQRPLPVEPKLVPLEPQDIPPGSVFRKPTDGYTFYTPVCVSSPLCGVYFADTINFGHSYAELMDDWQILRPGTTEWVACSKEAVP